MLIDLPIPINGQVYYLPLEFVIAIVILTITTIWYWRKFKLSKIITKWIARVDKVGNVTGVYTPKTELGTMVTYNREGTETPEQALKPANGVSFLNFTQWHEMLAIHYEQSGELFNWANVWKGTDTKEASEEMGAGRLLQEASDIVHNLKTELIENMKQFWWLYLTFALLGFFAGAPVWLHTAHVI